MKTCGCCSTMADTWAARGPSIFTAGPILGSMVHNAHLAGKATEQIERRRGAGQATIPVRGLSRNQDEVIRKYLEAMK